MSRIREPLGCGARLCYSTKYKILTLKFLVVEFVGIRKKNRREIHSSSIVISNNSGRIEVIIM